MPEISEKPTSTRLYPANQIRVDSREDTFCLALRGAGGAFDWPDKEWSLESRKLAVEKGYLNGQLKGSTSEDTAPELPAGYTKEAKAVAERQGALAGYRLADEIQKYLRFAGPVPTLPANNTTATKTVLRAKIGTAEASHYYEESMMVTGKVAQVTIRPTVAFIDIDGAGRNAPFTGVIFPDNLNKFGDLQRFKGLNVEVSGTITEYHNKPEIVLETAEQIKMVGGK